MIFTHRQGEDCTDHKEKTFSDKIINTKEQIDIYDKRYTKVLKTFSKEIFTTKKAYFSLLLDRMSHTRVCLLRAESKNDVDLCLEQELKRLLMWDEKIKQQLLYEKIEKLKA